MKQSSSMADRIVAAVLGCVGRIVYAVIVTACWFTGFVAVYVGAGDARWMVLYVALLAVWILLAVWFPMLRVREIFRYGCPIWGDCLRWMRRRARKRGNQWLRDSGLVHDADSERKSNYHVWLWSDRLVIDALPVVGVTADRVRDAVSRSLVAWNMADYDIEQTGNQSWTVHLYSVNRLDALKEGRVLSELPEVEVWPGHLRVRVGRDLTGDAWVDFSGISGVLLAGLPGAGKTSGADIIMSALLSRSDLVDVSVLDGKGGGDWQWAQSHCAHWSNDDSYDDALRTLHATQDLMRERLSTNRERYGDSNFWHVFGRSDARAVCLMVDEVQNWTAPATQDKETKMKAAEFIGLLTDIVKKGRSAGICVILATQKPDSSAIPTGLRDVCAKRFAFHVSTPEMARACLGVIPDGEPSPVGIAFADKGMAVTNTDTGGTAFVRFDYLPEASIESLLS